MVQGGHTERERRRDGQIEREREKERETETRVIDLLDSGVTPKRTRGYAFTFGGTDGLKLGRRVWFDAGLKGCFDAG